MPRWAPFALMAVIFLQLMLGALLAGSDGGRAYADWPTIGGEWLPTSAFSLDPIWRNFTEEHATQHLLHRTMGYFVALLALLISVTGLIRGQGAGRMVAGLLGVAAVVQVILGIGTVLSASALAPALVHQAGAAVLWMSALACARAGWR